AVWLGNGIVCASGGKLTTFRLTALQALKAAATFMPSGSKLATSAEGPIFAHSAPDSVGGELTPSRRRTLAGRFGTGFAEYMQLPGAGDETVADTSFALAELRYAARYEMVVHLDDLLLRRTRVGNVVPKGAASLFAEIEAICREELAWDDARWQAERERYQQIWRDHYDTPGP
ncbi:MAG: hypothetical protein JHC87_09545, partial [Thermoleophilaceae bacterium]|nr:hypothetical protein [Thermoleophilaceae bacterium]